MPPNTLPRAPQLSAPHKEEVSPCPRSAPTCPGTHAPASGLSFSSEKDVAPRPRPSGILAP